MQEQFMRPDAIAQILGVSKSRVYGLIKEHKIPGGVIAGAIRVPVQAWAQWLDEQSAYVLRDVDRDAAGDSHAE
jgi:excisionase family DNA binding protein